MAKYNKTVLQSIYKRIGGAMSGLAEINVKIVDNVTPHYDPNMDMIFMPSVISYSENDEEDFAFGRGIMVHEGSHVLFAPDVNEVDKMKLDPEEAKDMLEWLNVFADVNNEYKVTELWPHLKDPLAEKVTALVARKPAILKSDNPFIQVLLRTYALAPLNAEYPDEYDDEIKQFVEDTVRDFKAGNHHQTKADDLFNFTKEVYGKWAGLKSRFKANFKANSGNIPLLMKELGGAIKSKDKAKQEEIQKLIDEANKKRKWFKDPVDKRLISPLAKGMHGSHSNVDLEELKKKLEGSKQIIVAGKQGAPPPNADVKSERPVGNDPDLDVSWSYQQGKKMNALLKKKVKLEEDFESRQRSGSVDINEIRRHIGQMGQLCSSSVFKRKNEFTRGGKWAISVLTDCSGSMRDGDLMSDAKQALACLAYALDGLPNIKYELTGFDCDYECTHEYLVKAFKDKKFKLDYLRALYAGGGTPTATAMNSSLRRLVKFRQMKRLMVVITDGFPDNSQEVIDMVKHCERLKVKVIGIGIGGIGEKIRELFPMYYSFRKDETISKELTNIILACLGQRDKLRLVKRAWERR